MRLPNTLDGGIGYDNAVGGPGDDTYFIDNLFDSVTETRDGGNDTLHTAVSYTLPENVENLRLIGSDPIDGDRERLLQLDHRQQRSNAIDGGKEPTQCRAEPTTTTTLWTTTAMPWSRISAEGTDSVFSTISYTLGANVEALRLTGHQLQMEPATHSTTRFTETQLRTSSTAQKARIPFPDGKATIHTSSTPLAIRHGSSRMRASIPSTAVSRTRLAPTSKTSR